MKIAPVSVFVLAGFRARLPGPSGLNSIIRDPNAAGPPGRGAGRTKLGEDRNQLKADGNTFPEFILGWTIGEKAE